MKNATQIHDEHMHLRPHGVSPLPKHRLAPMRDACVAKGVAMGLREHAPLPKRYQLGPDGDYLFCMRPDEVDGFLSELEGSGVAVGFEVDHIDGCEDETRAIVDELRDRARARGIAFGGLTGSVHFIHGRVPDLDPDVDKGGIPHILCDYLETVMVAHVADHGPEATIRDYFSSVRASIRTGLYDVIGHLELLRKWDRQDERGVSTLFGDHEALYEEERDLTIALAGEADVILEYNTAGRDIVIGRPYLSDDAVRACVRHGVKIALSSDAHTPKQVGRYFDDAVLKLRSLGVNALWAARDGERIRTSL